MASAEGTARPPLFRFLRRRAVPVASASLLALLLAFSASPYPAAAQSGSGIRLVSSSAESRFPHGVVFRVEAQAAREISSITLRFQVLGQRALRYDNLEFFPALSVKSEILVRTDTAERFIPPGAMLEYFYEIEDAAGAALTTQPERFVLLDPRFDWQSIREQSVSISYYGPVRPVAERVLSDAQDTIERMGALIGVEVQRPLRLTMYNSWAEMRQALPPRSQVSEASLITEGVHFPSTGVVLILGSGPRVAGVTSHELVHFLLDEAMGPLVQLVPAWLNEGLAEYGSTAPSPSYGLALDSAIAQDRLIPLTSLNVPPGVPRDAILMYGEGKSVVTFMVETHGPEKLRGLLRRLAEGVSIDDALEATYGFDRTGLEQQWRRAIGAQPLPQPDSEEVRPTPVAYPTIVPFGVETPTPFPPSSRAPTPTAVPPSLPAPQSTGACGRVAGAGDAGLAGVLAVGAVLAFVRRRRD